MYQPHEQKTLCFDSQWSQVGTLMTISDVNDIFPIVGANCKTCWVIFVEVSKNVYDIGILFVMGISHKIFFNNCFTKLFYADSFSWIIQFERKNKYEVISFPICLM